MFDRLIAGAGAVSAGLDRFVRSVTPGSAMGNQPVSLLVAALLVVVAVVLVVFGMESSGSATLQRLDPTTLATADDLGNRVYATVEGRVPATYVETFPDADFDGIQDPDEVGQAWDYFLLGKDTDSGLIVRSQRPPSAIYTFQASGVVVEDAEYIAADLGLIDAAFSVPGLVLNPTLLIDATAPATGTPVDLAAGLPGAGTAVSIDASRTIEYVPVCSFDPDGDGLCTDDEVDVYDVIAYDPVSLQAVVVVTPESPRYQPATFTGIVRKDARSIDSSINAPGVSMAETGITLSPTYLLDDGAVPVDATTLLALAGILVLVAAVIAIGVVGGYVVFRGGGALPAAAATFAPGERLPVGVTGALRAPSGLVHVREAPADVVRFVVAAPVASEAEAGAPTPDPAPEATDPAPEATDSEPVWPAPVPPASEPMPAADAPPTMIVERQGRAEGVAVGRGELEGIESGTVATFRARRPALRLRAGTGRLVISFPNEDARDRVAAELAVETAAGLTAETAAGPAAEPAPIEEDR